MKVISIFIVIFGFQCLALGGYAINSFERAKQAHMEKRFTEAIDILEKEIKTQPNNPDVYFNLGLAYKAEKQYPKAIWSFEKTLKLKPKDSEAIQLIETSYSEMDSDLKWQDETGTFQRALVALGSNFWAVLAIVLSLVATIGLISAKRTKKNNRRKWYIGTVVFSVVFLFVSVANAATSYSYENNHNYAILMDNLELQDGKVSKELRPGTKVKVEKWNKDGSASIQVSGKTFKVKKGLARI